MHSSDGVSEPMGHAHPHVQRRIDARCDGTVHIAARIVEQHFIVSDVHADRGQSGQISIKRRGQRILRIRVAQVGTDESGGLGLEEIRIGLCARFIAGAAEREVRHREHGDVRQGRKRRSERVQADRVLGGGADFQKFIVTEARTNGLSPERLGEAVYVALSTAKPKVRYAVIPQRFKNWTLPRLLPTRMLDAQLAKLLGLTRATKGGLPS